MKPGIIALTLSPAWDLTIGLGELVPGTSHRVEAAVGQLGGKGVNVARVLAALGIDVWAQAPVPTDLWPQASGPGGLVWDLTATPSPLRRSYALVEDSSRATVFNERCHPHPAEVWARLRDRVMQRLSEPTVRVLAISGSMPSDAPKNLVAELISEAHSAGVQVIVDTSGPALFEAARAGADWVKPNDEELAALSPGAGWATSARQLVERGVRNVLVSRGAEGMTLIDSTGPRLSARLPAPVAGNPTGAGDASVAALAWQLREIAADGAAFRTGSGVRESLSDEAVRTILVSAVGLSASAVLMPRAGQIHPSWPELRDRVHISVPQVRLPTPQAVPPGLQPSATTRPPDQE
ncbi:PfkB family carbohydrate kinase [Brevibacterium sp.]|uniref:1-phosphofructokinase family hexose kinase n=1 Tax=Brevibacterium sp. TaxID=1701 RepID=UPI0028125A73|nr:PfkB family carbohydrate kinase [Brevibacterium sp.]